MSCTIFGKALIGDVSIHHKDESVENFEGLRGRLVDRRNHSLAFLCQFIKELYYLESFETVQPGCGLI